MERFSDGTETVAADKVQQLSKLGGELIMHSWRIKDRRDALPSDMPLARAFYSYDLHVIDQQKTDIPQYVIGQLELPIENDK